MHTPPAHRQQQSTTPELPLDDLFLGMSELISATLALAPESVRPFKPLNHTKWVFTASGRMVRQFRDLGMSCVGRPHCEEVTGIISDEPEALTSMAMTHAWMLAIAQRTAVDIRQLELIESPRAYGSPGEIEINAIALLAGCTQRKGCGDRLAEALKHVARHTLERCDALGARAQFMVSAPVQTVSPLTKQTGLPFTTCRVRAEGIGCDELLEILRDAARFAGGEQDKPTGELLVMSNLWHESKVS